MFTCGKVSDLALSTFEQYSHIQPPCMSLGMDHKPFLHQKYSNWHFSSGDERCGYFANLIADYNERWPVKVLAFPHIPLEFELDEMQTEELERVWVAFYKVGSMLELSWRH